MEALDKVVTQWFYLNLLNTAALVFFLIKNYPIKSFFLQQIICFVFQLFCLVTYIGFFCNQQSGVGSSFVANICNCWWVYNNNRMLIYD